MAPRPRQLSMFPGFKEKGATSRAAAEAIAPRTKILRDKIMELFAQPSWMVGLTTDEAAKLLREDKLAIRPRFTELYAEGLITKSAIRRKNESGASAAVWVPCRKPK